LTVVPKDAISTDESKPTYESLSINLIHDDQTKPAEQPLSADEERIIQEYAKRQKRQTTILIVLLLAMLLAILIHCYISAGMPTKSLP